MLLNCWCQPCGVSVPLDHSTLSVPCVEILQLGPVVYNSRSATRRRGHRCGTRTIMWAATLFRDRERDVTAQLLVSDSKNTITLARSSADVSPPYGFMLLPGTTSSGVPLKRSRFSFSHTTSPPFMALE